MSRQRTAGFSVIRTILLFSLLIAGFLLVLQAAAGLSATSRIAVAMQRIFDIALADSTETIWLIIVCAGAGVAMLLNHRRRTKARQAAS